ncbi:efflux transporter outer membrane subunit [Abyssalbus ytuae]|uniref:TolC family protein n=1 Tax=Abyssalbus ytuae TaxID=2926907 RepID=A0A9E6ZNR3_9FLAO|nr:TolC family protein [Abyssalbus ytuae]UOB18094.1 TolC family protein [Abyssalbus ytuae]
MKYIIKITNFFLAFFGVFFIYGQEKPVSEWKWHISPGDDVVLYIGNDTITQSALPITNEERWWESFGYGTLNTLEQTALTNNLDLKIAVAKLKQARANKNIALSTLFPGVRLEPSFTRQEFSANRPNPFGGQLSQVTLNTYEAPLTVSYELDVFGKNINSVEASNLVYKATEENRKQVLLEITTEVAGNYFLLIQLDAEIDLMINTEKTRLDNLDIASTRYNAGLVSQIDELRAKTELASVQAQLKNIRKLRAEIELILGELIGEDVSTFKIAPTKIRYLPPNVEFMRKDSLSLSRPDLRAARLMIESGEKILSNQKKQLLPSFYLNGAYGYLSGNSDNLIERDSRAWFAGITASLPLFEGGRKRAEIKLRRSELEEKQRDYEQALLQAYRQVENAFSNLHWIREQLLAQQEFVVAARDVSGLTNERYRKGLVNYIDVVDAERQVLEAERLSVQLFGQELTERVNLIKAMALYPQPETE